MTTTQMPIALLANDGQQSSALDTYVELAKQAEAKNIDLFIVNEAETAYTWEPQILLAHLVAQTSTIGFGIPLGLAYGEPYHVARILATIDHFSNGRVAFEAKPYLAIDQAKQYIKEIDAKQAPLIAQELLEVVIKLWDSWEDDAIINNKETGQFLNTDKIRHINHEGQYFKVRGPSPAPRPVQGHISRYAIVDQEISPLVASAEVVFLTGDAAQVEASYKGLSGNQKVFVPQAIVEQLSFVANGVWITPSELSNVQTTNNIGTVRNRLGLKRPELTSIYA